MCLLCGSVTLCLRGSAAAQSLPAASERVTFQQAIDRAIRNNPTIAAAAAGILRAEGLLAQARSATRLQVTGNVTTTTLNRGVEFSGTTVTPRNQVTLSLTADQPIVAAAAWARRAQAEDAQRVAELATADVKRQVALATADAYLTIIAQRRNVENIERARDVARLHFDLATELEARGRGSRLNVLRAQQQVSINASLVETTSLALYRAQEALGVLIVVDGPADAVDEPAFEVPADAVNAPAATLAQFRTDLKLLAGEQQAAERVLRDTSREWWPSVDALFLPQSIYPSGFFFPTNSWRFLVQANVPMFDSGQRASLRTQRQAALDVTRANVSGAAIQASSQVRAARAAVDSGERTLARARESADQAQQVVDITNVAFRAGGATNIEVIDAERTARDADTAVAVAEDMLRRARFELLNALGRFP